MPVRSSPSARGRRVGIALVGAVSLSLLVLAPAGAAPPAPHVTSFAPTQGPVATSVTISGSGFNSTTSVTFNGVEASFSQNTASTIVAGVPAGATSGAITVTTRHGSSTSAGSFTVSQQKPNIVLILTDDQRSDELSGMPIVNSELIDKGLSFTNGFVEDRPRVEQHRRLRQQATARRLHHVPYRGRGEFDDRDVAPRRGLLHRARREILQRIHAESRGLRSARLGRLGRGRERPGSGWPGRRDVLPVLRQRERRAPLLRERPDGLLHGRARRLRDEVHHERAVEQAAVPVFRSARAAPARPGCPERPERVPGPRPAPSAERERG